MSDRDCSGRPDHVPGSPCLGVPSPLLSPVSPRGILPLELGFSNTESVVYTPNYLPYQILTLDTTIHLPYHSRARGQPARNSPYAPGPLKLFKQANPSPVYSVSPIPPWGNHRKGSCPGCPITARAPTAFPPPVTCGALLSWEL